MRPARRMRDAFGRRSRQIENRIRDWIAASVGRAPRVARPDRIIFVCRGNICRSVLAEHLYRQLDPTLPVSSAGVDVQVSVPPPPPVLDLGRRQGLDLGNHRSRPLEAVDDTPGTVYLVLEPWHAREGRLPALRRAGRVHLLGLWATPRRAVITDPYGGDAANYERTFSQVISAVRELSASFSTRASH